jgi:group I intron endonuclease
MPYKRTTFGTVYKITNLINGKIYIGATITALNERWLAHCNQAKRKTNNMPLHEAIRDHGRNKFSIEALCTSNDRKCLLELEKFYIKQYKARTEFGNYNLTDGGLGVTNHRPNRETRVKMSTALMGNKRSLGKKMTEDNKRKLIEAKKNLILTDEMRRNISLAQRKDSCRMGHGWNPETTYINPKNGHRDCLACRHIRVQRKKDARPVKIDTCKQGHLWQPETTYIEKKTGKRHWKICTKARLVRKATQ